MTAASSDVPRDSARTILVQFVVFPLLFVAVAVLVFLLFGSVATESDDVSDSLDAIRSGSSHRRWQAAYQLAMSIQRGEAAAHPELAGEVIEAYRAADDQDPRVQRYLAVVLGRLGDRRATPVLLETVEHPDVDTRVYSILALGELADPAASAALTEQLQSPERDVRKSAAWALGRIGDPSAAPQLQALLRDPEADVRFNAALALAALDDPSGIGVLRQMLDRNALAAIEGMRPDQSEAIVLQAIPAYLKVARDEARPILETLAATDPSLRVQSAARDALRTP